MKHKECGIAYIHQTLCRIGQFYEGLITEKQAAT